MAKRAAAKSEADNPRMTRARNSSSVAPEAQPSHDDIARRAFELYLARGGADGDELQDWLRAESELRAS